jgi:hypothetical protein
MYDLEVAPPFNLISFPFDFVNNSILSVISPINDSFVSLNEYDNSLDTYNFYIRFLGIDISNFDTINVGRAYWLAVNESTNLTVAGSLVSELNESVDVGFNLVGFPFIEGNQSVAYVLRSIDGQYNNLNVYDNAASSYLFYTIFGGTIISNFNVIEPTLGYWVNINETTNITLP